MVQKQKTLVPEKTGLGSLEINQLTGDLHQDGLNRYELDLIEAAEFTSQFLSNITSNQEKLQQLYKPFIGEGEFCIQYTDEYSFDFTKPLKKTCDAKLHFNLDSLNLEPKERHAFLLLVGDKYDPYTNSVTLDDGLDGCDSHTDAQYDRVLKKYSEQLRELLKVSKVSLLIE